ncbi:DUF2778 domain-containing protein [Mesorhizobium sp. A556]
MVVRCVAISGAGLGVALLSLAGIAGLVLIATSLTSSPGYSRNAATPARLALAATLYAAPSQPGCMPECRQREPYIVQQAKAPRSAKAVDATLKTISLFDAAAQQRLDRTHASLSHDQLAAVLAHAKAQLAELDLKRRASLNDRFYPAARNVSLADPSGPDTARFGPQVAEVERSSRLALALSGAAEIRLAYAPQAAMPTGPAMPLLAALEATAPVETAEVELFEIAPERVPLPDSRPTLEAAQPRRTQTAERRAPKPDVQKPGRSGSERQQTLAYAPPDDDAPSIGQAFKNLFSSSGSPSAGNGVAVYDISAQTVTLPNGQVLEAHSGVGHMADNPRYANQKMNGPTPPNTYRLVMRESRFHGVEAIRMLPVDGKNKYGRDGILAHSYLLRGRPGQSHGCVAFADYDRFLKAFKQGKIKQIVVVPGRSRSSTRIAKNGQGV